MATVNLPNPELKASLNLGVKVKFLKLEFKANLKLESNLINQLNQTKTIKSFMVYFHPLNSPVSRVNLPLSPNPAKFILMKLNLNLNLP